jgi:DNA-binding XRE family transcriptional regulator
MKIIHVNITEERRVATMTNINMHADEQQYTLKELRARKNWTQAESAARLGISLQTYNAWEKDISNVAVSKVQAVADLYEVRLDQIKLQ